MAKKRSVDELLFLACIFAEQDRTGMADCDKGENGQEAAQLAKEIRAYRLKRWGHTRLEREMESAERVPLTDILSSMRKGKSNAR